MSEYLDFIDATPRGRKTKIIGVYAVRSGDILGEIKWYGRWRQYTFWPRPDTIFNIGCMEEISLRISALMHERRAA